MPEPQQIRITKNIDGKVYKLLPMSFQLTQSTSMMMNPKRVIPQSKSDNSQILKSNPTSYLQRTFGNQVLTHLSVDAIAIEHTNAKRVQRKSFSVIVAPLVQKKCPRGNAGELGGECEACKRKHEVLQRQMVTPLARGGGYSGLLDRDRRKMECTINSIGQNLPPVGRGHPLGPAHMLPCRLTLEQVSQSPYWCLDTEPHRNEICYRKIPRHGQLASKQYCYTKSGCCHSSPDRISPVDPESKGFGAKCSFPLGRKIGHFLIDYFPERLRHLW